MVPHHSTRLTGRIISRRCLRLVDWTSRLLREGKAHLDAGISSIFERLGADSSAWVDTLSRLMRQPRRSGSYFGRPPRLAEAALAHGRRWHRNQIRRTGGPLCAVV